MPGLVGGDVHQAIAVGAVWLAVALPAQAALTLIQALQSYEGVVLVAL